MSMPRHLAVLGLAFLLAGPAAAETPLDTLPEKDRIEVFAAAVEAGHTGTARKTLPVDARPAIPGEIVVTVILGEGVETRSKPAEAGDFVVRNRCPETGNEEYLVSATRFAERYSAPQSAPDAAGYRAFTPVGVEMDYTIIAPEAGEFAIIAPWGEKMRVVPGDALVRSQTDPLDIYRVESRAFACTYEILDAA